ncbi:uncharacterized protein LOC106167576 [Lingula anatina]|uniref:RBR-type E3 ubiquitin transferase n=1 Tax=Lingula anatina TaxID=7574 RepID=A0A1S3IV58_LINAN|nr:uncharacterized protein LOC106167576 [Lingula anatina]|eukprot:XP_013401831.1 uncharacterized protein LOC106167576 [Lingula anatina]
MVLKRSKQGLNTGCSMPKVGPWVSVQKCWRQHHTSEYKGGYIIKEILTRLFSDDREDYHREIEGEFTDIIQDGGLRLNARYNGLDVLYSLNKRKRWLLPGTVKEAISDADAQEVEKSKLTLFERSTYSSMISPRRNRFIADCIGYHDSKRKFPSTYPKSKRSYITDLRRNGMARNSVGKTTRDRMKEKRKNNTLRKIRGAQRHQVMLQPQEEKENAETEREMFPYASPHVPTDGPAELRYEVCYPTRPVAHMLCKDGPFRWDRSWPLNKAKSKGKGRRNNPDLTWYHYCKKWESYDGVDWLDDEILLDEENVSVCSQDVTADQDEGYYSSGPVDGTDDQDNPYKTYKQAEKITRPFTLSDFLTNVSLKKKSMKKEKRNSSRVKATHPNLIMSGSDIVKFHSKGSMVILIDEDSRNDEYNVSDKNDQDTGEDSVNVTQDVINSAFDDTDTHHAVSDITVTTDSISDSVMRQYFGGRYRESYTVPRRFVIDISKDISSGKEEEISMFIIAESLGSIGHGGLGDTCDNGWDFCDFDIQKDTSTGVVQLRVQVKGDLSSNTADVLQSTMFDLASTGPCPFHDVVENIVQTLGQLDVCSEKRKNFRKKFQSPQKFHFSLLQTVCGWKMENYDVETRSLLDIPQKDLQDNSHRKTASLPSCTPASDDRSCDICYSELTNGEASALLSCQHWFCVDCWRDYLLSIIKQGFANLVCPAYKCSELVDPATVLCLVPLPAYQLLEQRTRELAVDTSPHLAWCPNPKCGRTVQVQRTQAFLGQTPCVGCDCGATWCFDCHEEAHWPATCDLAANYQKILKQNGHTGKNCNAGEDSYLFYVRVKKCPHCSYPMQKNGGCQHMTCRCGQDFCWECLKPWTSNHLNSSCSSMAKKETTVELDSAPRWMLRTNTFYRQCLRHRRAWKRWRAEHARQAAVNCCHIMKVTPSAADFIYDVIKLKAEYHMVMENVYTIMCTLTRRQLAQNKLLFSCLERLDFFASQIEQMTSGQPQTSFSLVVKRLTMLSTMGEDCVRQLGRLCVKLQKENCLNLR